MKVGRHGFKLAALLHTTIAKLLLNWYGLRRLAYFLKDKTSSMFVAFWEKSLQLPQEAKLASEVVVYLFLESARATLANVTYSQLCLAHALRFGQPGVLETGFSPIPFKGTSLKINARELNTYHII